MFAHDRPLISVEVSGLVKDGVGHAQLPKIVQEGCAMEQLFPLRIEPHRLANG